MGTALLILLVVLVILVLVVVLLPRLTNNETLTLDEAIEDRAPGQIVTVDGKRMHYVEKGEGKPLILIHGFLYHTVMWKKNIDALAERFKVYAIDLWGWGFSERIDVTRYSYEQYGRQVIGFMDALEIDKATLIGQSMGGGTAVYVAAHHPERVERLILVSPTVLRYNDSMTARIYKLPYIGEFLNAIPGDALMEGNIKKVWFYDRAKVTKDYADEVLYPFRIRGTYTGAMYILRNVLKPPYLEAEAELLAKRGKPTLIVHGRQDAGIPLERSQALEKMWKDAKLVVFDRAGHTAHEEHPDQFNSLVLEFVGP